VDTHLRMGKSLDVVHLEDVFEDHFHVHLILELCLGGQLFSRKDIASGVFSEATAASVMRSVLRGIAQCHAKNVAFRDIKPENFMYVSTEEGAPLKLSDFGMATFFNPGEPLTERCGTVYYTAPEVSAHLPILPLSIHHTHLSLSRALSAGDQAKLRIAS